MRPSRIDQLHYENGHVHMYWRCHNKEFYLKENETKQMYLNTVIESLEITSTYKEKLSVSAFCVMDNHFHQLIQYKENSMHLSNYMRRCHGKFGYNYNRLKNRSGKVAESRPKTSLIENVEHMMRVHMYIEANPIKGNKCTLKQLRFQKFCSYAFYAYGKKSEFTQHLAIPDWYLQLGNNDQERQKKYRQLFEIYLAESGLSNKVFFQMFIGSNLWIISEKKRLELATKNKKNYCATNSS